jgi:hypothetical protein
MDPTQFPWQEDYQVTVKNPTDKDYTFQVHGKYYKVSKGKAARMAGYIAWIYVYNMACMLAQNDNQFEHWNEEGFRAKYFEKVYLKYDAPVQETIEEEPVDATSLDVDIDDDASSDQSEPEDQDPPAGQGSTYESESERKAREAREKQSAAAVN